jgi:hypothetical protein
MLLIFASADAVSGTGFHDRPSNRKTSWYRVVGTFSISPE